MRSFIPFTTCSIPLGSLPATSTSGRCHVRDKFDQKRMMITVVIAMFFPLVMGLYNVGYQANVLIQNSNLEVEGWRAVIMNFFNIGFDPKSVFSNVFYGSLYFIPILLVTLATGGFWEVLFAVIRKHDVTEGFLVTGFLIPLTLPPTIPLWQVAIGTTFAVVLVKEIFGGVGFNILNPALIS